jgi:glycosyltransferase involved in cell wall biosynthesis
LITEPSRQKEIQQKQQSWTIIIFGYNEESTISSVISKVNDFLIKHDVKSYEIIVVDDGSKDGTKDLTNEIAAKNNKVKIIRHPTNLGIGPAMISGYQNASLENLVAVPADGQFNIEELSQFLSFPDSTFISFYREIYKKYSPYRYFVTITNKLFNRYILGLTIKDINWVKVYKTSDLKNIDLKLNSSLIGSEICAKLTIKGYKAVETPSVYHDRVGGKSRGASLKTITQAILELLKLAVIIKKYKRKKRNLKKPPDMLKP